MKARNLLLALVVCLFASSADFDSFRGDDDGGGDHRAFVVSLFASPAFAQVNPFVLEVYPYETPEPGAMVFHSFNSFVPEGHHGGENGTSDGLYPSDSMFRTALELSYGLTESIEAGAYLDLAHANGTSLEYAGSAYRLQGRLFERDGWKTA